MRKIIIIFILGLAAGLRFWDLENNPIGFHLDEVSMGYNAYSILETGKDEYGKSWPLLIRSFGDYKMPVYTYLIIPVYKFFGVGVWQTRAVSAAAGVITIGVLMWWLAELGRTRLGLIVGLMLAISPWHLMMSRAVIEANVGLMFLVAMILAVVKFLKGGRWWLIVAGLMAVLAFTSYHAERLIVPIIGILVLLRYRKKIFEKKNRWWLVAAGVVVGMGLLPTLMVVGEPGFMARAGGVSLFGVKTEELWGYGTITNRWYLLVRQWASLYTAYFSPRYLFSLGDSIVRNSFPDMAPFFWWQLPFLILGLIRFLRGKRDELWWWVTVLLLLSPLAASMVTEPFGTIRALPMVIAWVILIGLGLERRRNWLLAVLVLMGLGRIYLSVFKMNNYYRFEYWSHGYRQMVEEIEKYPGEVVVDNYRGDPYIEVLFFLKYDPRTYQKDNVDDSLYYSNATRIKDKNLGRISLRGINWKEDVYKKQLLAGDWTAIGDEQLGEHCLKEVFRVVSPNDRTVIFRGVETNPEVKLKKSEENFGRSAGDGNVSCGDVVVDEED